MGSWVALISFRKYSSAYLVDLEDDTLGREIIVSTCPWRLPAQVLKYHR
jgi:hypothetical protein